MSPDLTHEGSNRDFELMLQLNEGDDLALNEIMERWQAPLVSFIFRYTGNSEDAVDLAQEVFVRLFESRQRFVPRGKFSSWLFTVASNLCRNHARWRRRHPTISFDSGDAEPAAELVSPEPSPAQAAESSELAKTVREQIQRLPHDLRTVVLLFEYEDLGYDDIAAILGCSAKAVETRLYRARKLLREALSRRSGV